MRPRRVEVRRVPETELHVDRGGDPDQLRELVQPDEAAEVVGRLDVEIDRHVDGRPDRRDLREREVRGHVERVRPQPGEDPRRARVRGRERDGYLRLHVLGKLTRLAHRLERREQPDVGDQHAPDPVGSRSPDVLQRVHEALLAVARAPHGRPTLGPSCGGGAPRGGGLREQTHLDPSLRGESRHLVQLVVGQEEAPASL